MERIEPILDFYKSPLSDKVKKLCEPLETTFGIDSFCYQVNSSTGRYAIVSNTPEIISYYYGNHFYRNNPYIKHPDNYQTGAILPLLSDQEYRDSQLLTNQEFGMNNILFLTLKEGSLCHIFGFSTTKKGLALETVYLNHLPLLEKFRDYFLKEWRSYSNKMNDYTVNIGEIIGPKYYERRKQMIAHLPESIKKGFLSAINSESIQNSNQNGNLLAEKTITLIEQDLSASFEIGKLSKAVGASQSTLMRHFKTATNQTLHSYIKNRRMDEAMKLIKAGTYSIGEVALSVGYENFGAFSEAFKAQFKKPPSFFKP